MSLGNIIGALLGQGTSSQSHNRLRMEAENAGRGGGIDQMLGSLMGATGGGGGLAQKARDFLGKEQAAGMSGAKIGGIGAVVGQLATG